MPYCPNCREEYVEGMSACAECGGDLIDGDLPDEVAGIDDLEAVFFGVIAEALVVKSTLENRGFDPYIMGEESALPLFTSGAESVSVLVKLDQAEDARDIIEGIRQAGFKPATQKTGRAPLEEAHAFTEGPYPDLADRDSGKDATVAAPTATKPAKKSTKTSAKKTVAKKSTKTSAKKTAAKKSTKTSAKKTVAKKSTRASAKKTAAKKSTKTSAKKTAAKKSTKTSAKKTAVKKSTRASAKKTAAKKSTKTSAKKTAVKKSSRASAKKTAAKKSTKTSVKKKAVKKSGRKKGR